ncbi:MAG: hypothetical protein Q4C53_05610 [Clostridia bacterium]|nr:hypothetical protein [Clostridia bacterium]
MARKKRTLEETMLRLIEEGDNKRLLCEAVLDEALTEKRSGAARAVFSLVCGLNDAKAGNAPLTVRFDLGGEYEK